MPDKFTSSKLRLERAREHIADLESRLRTFFDASPYTQITESNPEKFQVFHKLKLNKPFPNSFAVVAADVVDNLRSALDQAWYAVAVASRTINPNGKAYFPFANDPAELEQKINKGCKRFPQEILSLLRAFQPYKGGNDLLWALNRVCAANKHKMLAPTCILTHIGIPHLVCTGRGDAAIIRPYWDRSKNEIVYFISDTRNRIECNIQLSFNVAFDEVEIVSGKPVLAILNDMMSIVERILMALEAETRRLGYI